MKNLIFLGVATLIMASPVAVENFCKGHRRDNRHYERDAIVYKVEDDTITCIDREGNFWDFVGDNYKEGNFVKLLMDDMNTDNIHDDEIIQVK